MQNSLIWEFQSQKINFLKIYLKDKKNCLGTVLDQSGKIDQIGPCFGGKIVTKDENFISMSGFKT